MPKRSKGKKTPKNSNDLKGKKTPEIQKKPIVQMNPKGPKGLNGKKSQKSPKSPETQKL